jgi:hypothetical protein
MAHITNVLSAQKLKTYTVRLNEFSLVNDIFENLKYKTNSVV